MRWIQEFAYRSISNEYQPTTYMFIVFVSENLAMLMTFCSTSPEIQCPETRTVRFGSDGPSLVWCQRKSRHQLHRLSAHRVHFAASQKILILDWFFLVFLSSHQPWQLSICKTSQRRPRFRNVFSKPLRDYVTMGCALTWFGWLDTMEVDGCKTSRLTDTPTVVCVWVFGMGGSANWSSRMCTGLWAGEVCLRSIIYNY